MGSLRPDRRVTRSRRNGVPAVVPAAAGGPQQLAMVEPARARTEPLPDVVHVPDWLSLDEQQAIVAQFRSWARPPAGLRQPRMPAGALMSVQSVCLGWHWQPYGYSRTADDTDGTPVKPLPDELRELGRAAVDVTFGAGETYAPDAAIVNLYGPGARLGLHQDGEEPSSAPVVTISLGDTGLFRLAGVDRRTAPFTDIELRSGDLLVFGGRNRRVFHGVPKVLAATGPADIGMPPGRLSITIRETGLEA